MKDSEAPGVQWSPGLDGSELQHNDRRVFIVSCLIAACKNNPKKMCMLLTKAVLLLDTLQPKT